MDNKAFARRFKARREGLSECAKCTNLVKGLSAEGNCGACQKRIDDQRTMERQQKLLQLPLDAIDNFEDLQLVAVHEGVSLDARLGLDRNRGAIEARRRQRREKREAEQARQEAERAREIDRKKKAGESPIAGEEREVMLQKARSGKTTAMLSDALARAMQGESVVVIAVNANHANELHRTLCEELHKADLKFTKGGDSIDIDSIDPKIPAGRIILASPSNMDRVRGTYGTVLVDPDAAVTAPQRDYIRHRTRHPFV